MGVLELIVSPYATIQARIDVRKGPGFESRRRYGCLSSREVGGRGREVPDSPQRVLPQNWSETEKNRTVTCMVLKAKANDRRKNLTLNRDEFRAH
ncbi:hypothetical protein TNCV_1691561 [Trichonephila clavipes]|nr:hypothetical protein TNCV_1691561 [Trichonephila clavipes]